MSAPLDFEIAKERMLEARGALQTHIDSGSQNNEERKQLIYALNDAMDEFLRVTAKLIPDSQ